MKGRGSASSRLRVKNGQGGGHGFRRRIPRRRQLQARRRPFQSDQGRHQQRLEGLKQGIDLGGKFSDLGVRMGTSAGNAQILSMAGQNNGLGEEDVANAVGTMSKNIQQAKDGLATYQRAFDRCTSTPPPSAIRSSHSEESVRPSWGLRSHRASGHRPRNLRSAGRQTPRHVRRQPKPLIARKSPSVRRLIS